jgi:hypothetical protein
MRKLALLVMLASLSSCSISNRLFYSDKKVYTEAIRRGIILRDTAITTTIDTIIRTDSISVDSLVYLSVHDTVTMVKDRVTTRVIRVSEDSFRVTTDVKPDTIVGTKYITTRQGVYVAPGWKWGVPWWFYILSMVALAASLTYLFFKLFR